MRSIVAKIRSDLSFGMSLVASIRFVVNSSKTQVYHLGVRARITKSIFAVAFLTKECFELYFLTASIS